MTSRRLQRTLGCAEATAVFECGTCKSEVQVALFRNDEEFGGGLEVEAAHTAPDGTPCDLSEDEAEAAMNRLVSGR